MDWGSMIKLRKWLEGAFVKAEISFPVGDKGGMVQIGVKIPLGSGERPVAGEYDVSNLTAGQVACAGLGPYLQGPDDFVPLPVKLALGGLAHVANLAGKAHDGDKDAVGQIEQLRKVDDKTAKGALAFFDLAD